MKRFLFLTILLIGLTGNSFAATSAILTSTPSSKLTPTVSATSSSIIDKSIELLKQRIATSVAKIEKNISKLNVGHITKIDKTGIEIKTKDNKLFKVTVDNTITKAYSLVGSVKKEIKLDALAVNDYIIVSGPPLENSITANNIYVDTEYVVSSGKITEVDSSNFTIKVVTVDKDDYTLNIENSTKQQMLDIKTNLINPVGFSKMKVGDTIHFVAKKPVDIKTLEVSAERILIIPQEYFMK